MSDRNYIVSEAQLRDINELIFDDNYPKLKSSGSMLRKHEETKMFHINPHGEGKEWHVAATSKSDAIFILQMELKKLANEEAHSVMNLFTDHRDRYRHWRKARVNLLPDKYTIDEYDLNQILEGERLI